MAEANSITWPHSSAFVQKYRRGLLDRDPDQILRIVSPHYLDDSGTSDPADDIDRSALERSLRRDAPRVRVDPFDLADVRIVSEGDPIIVETRYSAVSEMEGRRYVHGETARIVIERRGGELLALSGL